MGARKLTSRQTAVLAAVERGDVTWNRDSFRLWANEDCYTLVTAQGRALVQRGLARTEMAAGYHYVQRGPVEITAAGRTVLAAAGTDGGAS